MPLAVGGVFEALKVHDATVPFGDVIKGTLPFLRVTTVGELCLAAGHVIFLANLARLVCRLYCGRAEAAYTAATADLFEPAEAKR